MPRRHKSKGHGRKKRPQARGDRQGCEDASEAGAAAVAAAAAEAAAMVEEEEEVEEKESSPLSHIPPAAVSSSPLLTLRRRSPSPGSRSVDGLCASFDEAFSCDDEETLFEASSEYMCADPQYMVELLQWFMLYKFRLKQLITKEDMLKALGQKYRDEYTEIFKITSELLAAVFAVEVREVDSIHHSYNLISMLKLPNNGRVRPGRGYPKTGLLMKVLGMIFMKGNCAPEEDIWKFLKKMQIYPGKKHIMFGDTKKLLTQDFVRLKYLVYRQVPGSDPPRQEFLWGPQAHAEIGKEKIVQFLSKISKISPGHFSCLYEDITKDEVVSGQATPGSAADPSAAAQATCCATSLPDLAD